MQKKKKKTERECYLKNTGGATITMKVFVCNVLNPE